MDRDGKPLLVPSSMTLEESAQYCCFSKLWAPLHFRLPVVLPAGSRPPTLEPDLGDWASETSAQFCASSFQRTIE